MYHPIFQRRRHPGRLRDACRTTCCAVALLLGSFALNAQSFPNGLSANSVDPQTDAVFIREMRRRLDAVRTQEKRPTVALVLSGGGAKGAAEVGAVRYLEELGIPIDFLCGTSIGGLVGGLYSLGYRSDYLTDLFQNQDWSMILSDRIPAAYIPYSTKMDRASFLFSIPVSLPGSRDRGDRADRIRKTLRSKDRNDLREAFGERPAPMSFASSLPSGYAFGLNVNSLLSSLSVGYQDSISFSTLPIPFGCVAADVVTSGAKYWGSGHLVPAMRSTMSIPGLFDPIRTDGMVLVDGGVRNTFPADLAKAVGADYIIGIDLSDARPDYDDINNLGNILGQFIAMLGEEAFSRTVGQSDVFIKPDLTEFNMLSFNREAVDTMLNRGYAAALAQRDALIAIRDRTAPQAAAAAPFTVEKPAYTDIARTPVRVSSIEYESLGEADARRMERLTGLDTSAPLDKQTIDEAMYRLQATGAFEGVSYSLYGDKEPYRLVFHCAPAPVHGISLGLRADSEEGAALLFRAGLGTNRLSGSKADLTARIGQNLRGTLHYSLDLGDLPTINAAVSAARYRGSLGKQGESLKYDVAYWSHREDIYITGVDWTRLDFRAGIAFRGYTLEPQTVFAREMTDEGMSLKSNYIGTYLEANYYTFDSHYFPTRGVSVSLRGDYDFLRPGWSDYSPVLSGSLDVKAAVPIGGRFCFLPDVRLRSISHFGQNAVDGLIHTNFAGGTLAERYTENQIPFFGINHVMSFDDYVVDAVAELRYNPVPNLYFSALAGVLISEGNLGDLVTHPLPDLFAVGVAAAYDTIAGPLRFNLHWSDAVGWGAHLSFGFDF